MGQNSPSPDVKVLHFVCPLSTLTWNSLNWRKDKNTGSKSPHSNFVCYYTFFWQNQLNFRRLEWLLRLSPNICSLFTIFRKWHVLKMSQFQNQNNKLQLAPFYAVYTDSFSFTTTDCHQASVCGKPLTKHNDSHCIQLSVKIIKIIIIMSRMAEYLLLPFYQIKLFAFPGIEEAISYSSNCSSIKSIIRGWW